MQIQCEIKYIFELSNHEVLMLSSLLHAINLNESVGLIGDNLKQFYNNLLMELSEYV